MTGATTDWSVVVKPLLNNRYGVLNKSETINVVKAIIRCENEFFDEDTNYSQFYTAFAALAADKLSQCKTVCQTQVPQIQEACAILIRFILSKLSKVSVTEIKWLLPALRSLCDGGKSRSGGAGPAISGTSMTAGSSSNNTSSTNAVTASTTSSHYLYQVQQFDYNTVAALLKSSRYPEAGGKSGVSTSSNNNGGAGSSASTSVEKDSPKSEIKRSRSDLSSVILQQLIAPLEVGKFQWTPLSEDVSDCSEIFTSANVAYLQSVNGADVILEVCSSLPILTRYRLKYQETIASQVGKPLYLPLSQMEALQIKNTLVHMATDISVLWTALSLPVVMQPLTTGRIAKLSKCAISALYCAILTSIANSVLNMSSSTSTQKASGGSTTCSSGTGGSSGMSPAQQLSKDNDAETEENARFIVDRALEIYSMIGDLFKTSARNHVYQNHLCFGAWLLVSGIQGALGASGSSTAASSGSPAAASTGAKSAADDKSATKSSQQRAPDTPTSTVPSTSARVNLFKVQQGFGVLNVAIAHHCIKLLTELVNDLRIETTCFNDQTGDDNKQEQSQQQQPPAIPEPANFEIMENYTCLQRLVRVLNTAMLHQLFTFLATVAYRKACALKRSNAKERIAECEAAVSYSDSTTYLNDTLSCSDNSEEDDSESYLGHWFKETLSPEANDDNLGGGSLGNQNAQERSSGDGLKSNIVPVVDEPHEYLDLAAQIFCFLDQFFAYKQDAYLLRYIKAGLSEQQMLLIANILKDLDRDASRNENEQNAGGSGMVAAPSTFAKWQVAMLRFSGAVGRYLHNLISANLLSESLQSHLLQQLGVSPWATDTNAWPLQVYSSTLSVLVQILLLKPTQEKEAACLSVWHRLINTLVEGVCATSITSTASDVEYEDLNVEHAQLLLFLFHSLNLMQKKSILLLTAGGVIRCAEVCRGINDERTVRNSQIMLLSRLLLFLEYLMKHLYNAPTELLDQVRWNLFSVSTMQENQKVTDLLNNKMKLISYCRRDIEDKFRKSSMDYLSNIRPTFYTLVVESTATPAQQEFKLDGLAWNFILCTPDKLKYPLLVDALIDILGVVDMTQSRPSVHTLCAVQYCFNICYKLLLGLPPSTVHVESLMEDKTPSIHSLLWSIRSPSAHYLIVNSLIKQGMYTQCAETLYSNVSERVNDMRFRLKQVALGVDNFNKTIDKSNPRLSQLILLDALLSHMRALAYSKKEGIKSQQSTGASGSAVGGDSDNNSGNASPNFLRENSPSVETQHLYSSSESLEQDNQKSKSTTTTTATSSSASSSSNAAVVGDTVLAAKKSPVSDAVQKASITKELLFKFSETLEIIIELVRHNLSEQLTDDNVPANIKNLIIPIASSKSLITADLNSSFLKILTTHDADIIVGDWTKSLPVTESLFRAEEYTLQIVNAHILELTRSIGSSYTLRNSLKNTLKSLLHLINLLLPYCASPQLVSVGETMKPILVAALLDVRLEYVHDITEKCLHTLMMMTTAAAEGKPTTTPASVQAQPSSTETSSTANAIVAACDASVAIAMNADAQKLILQYILRYTYKLLLGFADESRKLSASNSMSQFFSNESLIMSVLKTLNLILEQPMGLKAMHEFFKVNAEGSLGELMMSFTASHLSKTYAKRMLQFFEKLFVSAEKPDSSFPIQDLVACFSDLASIETTRLKQWLHHVIYGPTIAAGGGTQAAAGSEGLDKAQITSIVQPASTPSSNAQTPTNMATTVSAMPSISDQLVQPNAVLDDDDLDIEDVEIAIAVASAGGPAAATSSSAGEGAAVVFSSAPSSLWPKNGNNSCITNHSEESVLANEVGDRNDDGDRNGALLLSIVRHLVRDTKISDDVTSILFNAFLQLGLSLIVPLQETSDFSDILQIMITLADYTQARLGHAALFNAITSWLEMIKHQISDRTLNIKSGSGSTIQQITLDNVAAVLKYLTELLQSLGFRGSKHITPPWDDDMLTDLEDLMDDMAPADEEDSFVEDSDEDSLNNKLCTFSQTQKEFMNQHWYHCHTCNMINTVGVCSVCARVCHKGHEVSYAKFGNFFCDCGAKEDGSCQALSRRPAATSGAHGSNMDTDGAYTFGGISSGVGVFSSALTGKRRAQTPPSQMNSAGQQTSAGQRETAGAHASGSSNAHSDPLSDRINFLAKLLESNKETLKNTEQWNAIVTCILDLFDALMPVIQENCALYSIVGCHKRAKAALARLHTPEQMLQSCDNLMNNTLSSREGAFENVRMNYSGDQGQTIKQLLSSGLVRRVALCCLTSPQGKRQHLAVSHEKGKVTILQLSTLLKQSDASKHKVSLSQVSAAPVPCTVLSLTANPANEDCLAVCGLKECHILTFSNSGSASDHIVITPQLENGNYIKKALWLPGSQTTLALVTADYVKIYDLSEDTYSPKYYFVVAIGIIRDCTFVCEDGSYYLLIIASTGYIYYQKLDDESLAKHGDFYVTNTFELNHPHIKDVNGQVGGGGVSIYYSHTLQLLFFSYSMGRSYMAALTDVNKGIRSITQLTLAPALKNSSKGTPQALCQWTEVAGHPGLIFAMLQTSNNPVIFMLTPDRIMIQEIKALSSKARIMDMVAVRHSVSGVEKTTLILLCEEGSLRILAANPETTSFWLSPQVKPQCDQLYASTYLPKSTTSKKMKRKPHGQQKTAGPNGPSFPVDFFEHCTILSEVEFGGNDLLQIYNKSKLKSRLSSAGMYVASTKPAGFSLEIYNNDPNMCIVGIRVLLGTQDHLRAPQSVSVYGRVVPTLTRRARWFDIPLTKEEILCSDKSLKVTFGKSQDPGNVSMLDSIEVYGKSKDQIGWPEDDEVANAGGNLAAGTTAQAAGSNCQQAGAFDASYYSDGGFHSITHLDKMVTHLLEVLDCSLGLLLGSSSASSMSASIKQRSTTTITSLLLYPTPHQVQMQSRYVLATLFGNRNAYHTYKDKEMLSHVQSELQAMKPNLESREKMRDIDPEAFYRLILLVRSIATARPQSLTKICVENNFEIMHDLKVFVEKLFTITPRAHEPTSILRHGLCQTVTICASLVEILNAFALSDPEHVKVVTRYYIDLLKNDCPLVSNTAKDSILTLLSPKVKRRKATTVTPPICSTPTPSNTTNTISSSTAPAIAEEVLEAAAAVSEAVIQGANRRASGNNVGGGGGAAAAAVGANQGMNRNNGAEFVDANMLGEALGGDAAGHQQLLDQLLGDSFPQLLGLQQDDADDDTIMGLAIALSLQQANLGMRQPGHNLPPMDANLGVLGIAQNAANASAGGSDDEGGSNVATDGSTLPAEPAAGSGSASGGSESGGSGAESIGGTSARSSTYGDNPNASPPRAAASVGNDSMSNQSNASAFGSACGSGAANDCISIAEEDEDEAASGSNMPVINARAAANFTATEMTSNSNDGEESNAENAAKLHDLRISILENIIQNLDTLNDCNGIRSVPLMHVIYLLTSNLNGNVERDQRILHDLLKGLIEYAEMDSMQVASKMKERNAKNEVRLVLLYTFGVLIGKTKSSKQAGTTSPPYQFKDNASFVASTTAHVLSSNHALAFCFVVMESLLQHWKRVSNEQGSSSLSNAAVSSVIIGGGGGSAAVGANGSGSAGVSSNYGGGMTTNLLKPSRSTPRLDISILIPQNYLKNSNADVFESFDALLTEISVRLPYQILRLSATHPDADEIFHSYCTNMTYTLCEYMMLNLNAVLRRQVRKLLMYMCGSKESFRMCRDGHALDVHFNFIKDICRLYNTKNLVLSNQSVPILSYDSLVLLTERLRFCQEISQIRTGNWQKFCLVHEDVIPVLIEIACYQLDDGVSPIILQLLQAALCNNVQAIKQQQQQQQQQQKTTNSSTLSNVSTKPSRSDREKSEEHEPTFDSKFDPMIVCTFVHQIFRFVSDSLLNKFVRIFLLETNITSIRWQAHSLIYALYENSNDRQKEKLIGILWNMWPLVPAFGRRTAQFVDILGYLTLNTKSVLDKLPEYTEKAVDVLRQQNDLLAKHTNGQIYSTLEQVLQVNGYYLESEPCLVCNNPEVPMTTIKLPSIKSDSKFTTTTMIVKLVQSHTISKLVVRIADLKRTKMVRTINIYYNNRTVQAVVELKNRPAMWHKARSVTLQSGQTEIKIDFPLPITACNLMIEYADFYETITGSSENLQCPRCSAAVPAYPGVCSNCGENVFQCHKCRAINYDEKDPFLCHSCGFCKYAKFDFSIYGRVCGAVDPIESAEDRAKTVHIIHSSLERADRIYRQLQTNKQMLELLIQKLNEHRAADVDDSLSSVHGTSQVNKIIQLLAQKYCVESRASFEELSKIAQKIKACRSELVAYDRSQQQDQSSPSSSQYPDVRENLAINRCYGCALASTEQCLTLLRAMSYNYECRLNLYGQGLVEELALHNLRRGHPQIQEEVRNLLVLLTKNNRQACSSLLDIIRDRVKSTVAGSIPLVNLDSTIHQEMVLLEGLISQDDCFWEEKLQVVCELFLVACRSSRGPPTSIIQPCLRIMQILIYPSALTNKAHGSSSMAELGYVKNMDAFTVDLMAWLAADQQHSFSAWKARMPPNYAVRSGNSASDSNKNRRTVVLMTDEHHNPLPQLLQNMADFSMSSGVTGSTAAAEENAVRDSESAKRKRQLVREAYLSEKYGERWRKRVIVKNQYNKPMVLNAVWLQPLLFNTNSRFGRQLACSLISSLSSTHERKREILNILTTYLKYICECGEASAEFITLYRALASDTPWRQYLALRGVLTEITQLLAAELAKIHHLEETTLSSDLSQGYALRQFVELLAMFLESPTIRQAYKTRLLGPVLEGYLSLRKLVVQRTRLIDDAQEKLLEMLEEMTTGTEEETRAFMEILVDTVEKTSLNDIKTPVFIFERLYSIIHPEENDESEFFMTLEKDPQQEDFLQGRMLGNPYPSSEIGLGPLMRDVKNKICTDCELIALLEDDNGMELLVNNKIISLDLPVKEVYKKVWLAEGGERDAMRIVYRMRGLLGDATEEFVESLSNKSQEEVDTEQLYRMANVLADCNGLKVMLDRIGSLQNISRTRELIQVLLKLFLICVKVRRCQEVLCQPELGAINTLLKVLQMCLQAENDSLQSSITEQLLEIMETILSKAASDTLDSFLQFSLTFGGPEYVTALISCTNCPNVRNSQSVLRHLIRVLNALVYGNEVKMAPLCEHFKETFNFERFDAERTPEAEFKLELFCVLTNQIEHNCIGGTLKDYIVGLGIVERAIKYITTHAPCVKPTLLRTDSDELKEFISRPSLKYILRFLTGLANNHEATQLAISKDIIPIIHRLEQVSSDEHVGVLAENLLEALCTDKTTAARVQEVRDFTRAEKKRLAMATREKQLNALGMRTNEKGQVTAKGSILKNMEKLRDETGLTCFICREGYACQPAKVLGIYTFTKRCNVEEFELKSRKTIGYTTVTHFNVVHVDCHTSAIRSSRGRDEWERASLQNANTRCNGLLPLWGPDVSEAAFSACIARHSSYMQESTQRCDISFPSSIHDLKLLLTRFAWERSFHDDAGGGGPQSNMHFVPYLLFYGVYLLLSSRSAARDSKALMAYLTAAPSEKWLECAYDVEGPLYMVTISLALHSRETWNKHKLAHLKRLLVVAHARHISPSVLCKALLAPSDRTQAKEYTVYKPFLMIWALVDLIYNTLFKSVTTPKEEDWSISLFDYIRKNDEAMLKASDNILQTFTDEFLPCASFGEFCDVAGLLHTIENPVEFIDDLLSTLPTTVAASTVSSG